MKKILLLIMMSCFFVSCIEDNETYNKRQLFNTYEKIKQATLKNDINWFEKNSVNMSTPSMGLNWTGATLYVRMTPLTTTSLRGNESTSPVRVQ